MRTKISKPSKTEMRRVRIQPTQLVDCSYSAYKKGRELGPGIPPTQLVDCSYSAYKKERELGPGIPPTRLVDCSYSAYWTDPSNFSVNPINCVRVISNMEAI